MRAFLIFLALAPLLAAAPPRDWREADGNRSIRGVFVSRDAAGVTIRRGDLRRVTIPHERLHPDDIAWLDANHPLPKPPPPEPKAVFDTLRFGDTRSETLAKLQDSGFVELTINEALLARTGLNGVFRTRKAIGGLHCTLSFGWTDEGKLSEITLATESLAPEAYPKRIRACWEELSELLTTLHGPAIQDAAYPELADLQEGAFIASHLWRIENDGTILLGTSRDERGTSATVRFTTETIQPNRLPDPEPEPVRKQIQGFPIPAR